MRLEKGTISMLCSHAKYLHPVVVMNKQQLANNVRSKIEAHEYKDHVLGFIYYKYLSDSLIKESAVQETISMQFDETGYLILAGRYKELRPQSR